MYPQRITAPAPNKAAWLNEDISYMQTSRLANKPTSLSPDVPETAAWATDPYPQRITAPRPNKAAWVNEDISYLQTTGKVVPTTRAAAIPAGNSEEAAKQRWLAARNRQ